MATRTSTSAWKRFLVAEASASSSAPNTISLSTFFSRPRASTSNKISRLISVLLLYVRHQARHFLVADLERERPALHLDLQPAGACFTQHADEIALPAHRHSRLHARLLPRKTHKILFVLQQPVQPRR